MGVFGCPDEQGEVRMTTQEVSGEVDGGKHASRLPVLIIRVYNSGLEGVLESGGFDAEEIHGGVSSG